MCNRSSSYCTSYWPQQKKLSALETRHGNGLSLRSADVCELVRSEEALLDMIPHLSTASGDSRLAKIRAYGWDTTRADKGLVTSVSPHVLTRGVECERLRRWTCARASPRVARRFGTDARRAQCAPGPRARLLKADKRRRHEEN